MNDTEMIVAAETVEHEADPLTKAWWREVLRIGALAAREPWEEALLELTIELETTMKKLTQKHPLNSHDRFLLGLLRLLVLPNPQDPEGDRDKALARLLQVGPPGKRDS